MPQMFHLQICHIQHSLVAITRPPATRASIPYQFASSTPKALIPYADSGVEIRNRRRDHKTDGVIVVPYEVFCSLVETCDVFFLWLSCVWFFEGKSQSLSYAQNFKYPFSFRTLDSAYSWECCENRDLLLYLVLGETKCRSSSRESGRSHLWVVET